MSLKEQAEKLGIKVDGRWSDDRIKEEIDRFQTPKTSEIPSLEWANQRAVAIWEGQSPSLGIAERVGRIRAALKDKGFKDFDKLKLPTKDYERYL